MLVCQWGSNVHLCVGKANLSKDCYSLNTQIRRELVLDKKDNFRGAQIAQGAGMLAIS